MKALLSKLAVSLTVALAAVTAQAGDYTLSDGNSVVKIDTGDSKGVYSWDVDGIDHLNSQWFYLRVAGDSSESSLDTLNEIAVQLTDTDGVFGDPADDTLAVLYMDPQDRFRVTIKYTLTGGSDGSLRSDLAEIIRIDNLSGSPLDMTFIQYSDFELNGTPMDDQVSVSGGNTAGQRDVNSTINGLEISLNETVVTPLPASFQAGLDADILGALTDGDIDNLDGTTVAGPGDLAWAFQWDISLAASGAGSTFLISKDKGLNVDGQGSEIPEPASFGMLALGALAMLRRRNG